MPYSFEPGTNQLVEKASVSVWSSIKIKVRKWLKNLDREIKFQGKWAELENQDEAIIPGFYSEQDHFTPYEILEIKERINLITNEIKQLPLLAEQQKGFHAQLTKLAEATSRVRPLEWKQMFVGPIVSTIIEQTLSKEMAHNIGV